MTPRVSDPTTLNTHQLSATGVACPGDYCRYMIVSLHFSILDNIDLWAAGISENITADGQLGPTFSCLIGDQFERLKNGDRFYYMFSDAGFTIGK